MGNLLLDWPLEWLYTEVEYVGVNYHKRPKIASTFPFSAAIHNDYWAAHPQLDRAKSALRGNELNVAIRRFVHRRLLGDVVVSTPRMDYEVVKPPNEWRDKYTRYRVEHGYHVFHFEEEGDQAAFIAQFMGMVSEISSFHPGSDHTEEMVTMARTHMTPEGKRIYPEYSDFGW